MNKKNVFSAIYVILLLLLLYIPIITIVIYSFNSAKSGAVFTGFTLDWYKALFENNKYIPPLWNSLQVGILSSVTAAVIGSISAVGIASRSFKLRGLFETFSVLPVMIPEIILAIGFLSVFSLVGIPMSKLALILGHTTFCIPYIYIVVKGRLKDMDKSIIEAARTLGASPFKAFMTITLPLIFPAVISGTFLSFAMSFDDVIISSYLSGPGSDMLPVKILSSLKTGVTPELNALFALTLGVVFLAIIIGNILSKAFITKKIANINK